MIASEVAFENHAASVLGLITFSGQINGNYIQTLVHRRHS